MTKRSDRPFIWIFAVALLLLVGYKLLPDREVSPDQADRTAQADPPFETQSFDLAQMPNSMTLIEEPAREKVYTYVEQMPQAPGSLEGLMRYLNDNVKYPPEARREQVEGKVFVNFVVDTTGRFKDVQVIKGIGAGCDEEAVRLIRQMPAWTPGKQNDRVVNVSYTVPVTFTLDD